MNLLPSILAIDLPELMDTGGADEVRALTPVVTLSLAIAFGFVVAILHLLAHRDRPIYSLWRTLLLIAPLIAMATMAVGSNLAAAFTLFGTLAIVRFRTPIKDPLDAAFVIFSVVIGLALGNGSLEVASVGTGMIAALILALLAVNRMVPREHRSTLKLVVDGTQTSDAGWRTVLAAEDIRIKIDSCTVDRGRGTQTIRLSFSGIAGERWPGLLSKLLDLPEIQQAVGRTDEG
ncbi:MAG: hypothetical protein CMJ23_09025 [Phycisphaerae bacterium]|nr:hypothetical protein [Phycisphaerae bacterium]